MSRFLEVALRCSLLGFSIPLFFGRALGDEGAGIPHEIVISDTVKIPFTPVEVLLVVDEGGEPRAVHGVSIPPYREDKKNRSEFWLVGARVSVHGKKELIHYSFLIEGGQQETFTTPVRSVLEEDSPGSTDLLKAHLSNRKRILDSWQLQVRTQEESLKRLRADADLIADVGKILEIEDEKKRIDEEIAGAEKDMESLKRFIRLSKVGAPPANFPRRELELTKQVAELATSAREAESGENERRSTSQSDIQKKLQIIEATRYDDVSALESELLRVRQERQEIEARAVVP